MRGIKKNTSISGRCFICWKPLNMLIDKDGICMTKGCPRNTCLREIELIKRRVS